MCIYGAPAQRHPTEREQGMKKVVRGRETALARQSVDA
jgi:hypothetical protein